MLSTFVVFCVFVCMFCLTPEQRLNVCSTRWNVVEAAMLKHSTEQYYAYNKPETARERWTRIKRKAAKVCMPSCHLFF